VFGRLKRELRDLLIERERICASEREAWGEAARWQWMYHDLKEKYDALAAEQNNTKRRAIRAEWATNRR
jgi:hypothetical protein